MKFFSNQSQWLREVAINAAQRSVAEPREAWVAIVFSALTIEAMINEISLIADFVAQNGSNPGAVTLSHLLRRAESEHTSVTFKLELALAAAGGKYDEPTGVFQEVNLLFKLRNELVHLKGEVVDNSLPEVERLQRSGSAIKGLVGLNILNRADLHAGDTRMETLANPRVANWACKLPPKFAEEFLGRLPDDTAFKMFLGQGWFEVEASMAAAEMVEKLRYRHETLSEDESQSNTR